MRFGVCTSLEEAHIYARAGFDYVELQVAGNLRPFEDESSVIPALKAQLNDAGIPVEVCNVFLPGDLKVTGPNADQARQELYLQSAFDRAQKLGVEVIVFGSGAARGVPDGFSVDVARAQIVDFLKRAGKIASEHGVTIAIEPLHGAECNIINGVAEGMRYVQEVNLGSVRILSDLYHVAMENQPFSETSDAGKYLAHVHIARPEGRVAPTSTDIPLLLEYFKALREAGYDQRISIESGWPDKVDGPAEAIAAMKSAWEKSASG